LAHLRIDPAIGPARDRLDRPAVDPSAVIAQA